MSATAAFASTPSPLFLRHLEQKIRNELHARKGLSFEGMQKRWASLYGSEAVSSLLLIAGDRTLEDSDRYIALMSAAKLSGPAGAPAIARFLKDPSWMLRSAALRALTALDNPSVGDSVLPLLEDRALVVRSEAVRAVRKLKPKHAAQALLKAAKDPRNFHAGKALWVPSQALQGIIELGDASLAPSLSPLIKQKTDPQLRRQALAAATSLRKGSGPNPSLSRKTRP